MGVGHERVFAFRVFMALLGGRDGRRVGVWCHVGLVERGIFVFPLSPT